MTSLDEMDFAGRRSPRLRILYHSLQSDFPISRQAAKRQIGIKRLPKAGRASEVSVDPFGAIGRYATDGSDLIIVRANS